MDQEGGAHNRDSEREGALLSPRKYPAGHADQYTTVVRTLPAPPLQPHGGSAALSSRAGRRPRARRTGEAGPSRTLHPPLRTNSPPLPALDAVSACFGGDLTPQARPSRA